VEKTLRDILGPMAPPSNPSRKLSGEIFPEPPSQPTRKVSRDIFPEPPSQPTRKVSSDMFPSLEKDTTKDQLALPSTIDFPESLRELPYKAS
jgi:hypothetical protein